MNFIFVKPNQVLSPYIERYWICESNAGEEIYMPRVLPGVGMDFFLHYKSPFKVEGKGQLPSSHIIYSGERSCNILPMKDVGFIAIRFRAAMFKNFTEIPFSQLANSYLDVENIWGHNGKNILRSIRNSQNVNDVIKELELSLMKLLNRHKKRNATWGHVIHELYHNHSDIKLSELSQELNISYRHFRRKFIEETGFTPKHFQKLARFHATLKPLLIGKEKKYLSAALGNGYFDQTHFIKEFRSFTNTTPTDFLQEKNFMSHFYYPSL